MKYILWKRLKTKSVAEFISEDIQEVLDYAVLKGYEFTGIGYFGGFAEFRNLKGQPLSIQGQVNGIVCSYDKSLIKVKPLSSLEIK